MYLIDRYLHAIGRYLPAGKRDDLLAELRSVLEDRIEAGSNGQAEEQDIVEAIKEMGPPHEVAAAYHPEQQYLIGPALFPLFRMVAGIVVLSVIGAQLVAVAVSLLLSGEPVDFVEAALGMVSSIPAALGWVVLVFAVLQRYEVRPEEKDMPFDPYDLPKVEETETISRAEKAFSIVFGVVFLVVLAWFANQGGFGLRSSGIFFENPVLVRYFPWIALSIFLGIAMDIILLWRGRWQLSTRIAEILVNLFSLGVLSQLIRGHDLWLEAAGYTGSFLGLTELPGLVEHTQLAGMLGFRLAFSIAALVIAIETVVQIVRLGIRLYRRQAGSTPVIVIRP